MRTAILAIDQGSVKCGWAYREDGKLISSGVWKLKGKTRKDRYKQLIAELNDKISDNNIRTLAIEDIYQKRTKFSNPQLMKIMGETRGVIIGVGLTYDLDIIDLNPNSLTAYLKIKLRTENKKDRTRAWVKDTEGLDVGEDEADAIALSHMTHAKLMFLATEIPESGSK